jgi:hypothetical protein
MARNGLRRQTRLLLGLWHLFCLLSSINSPLRVLFLAYPDVTLLYFTRMF